MVRMARQFGIVTLVAAASFCALAQPPDWSRKMAAAEKAYSEHRYSVAEGLFNSSLKDAEAFGSADPRLAANLTQLAQTYQREGKYANAEPLYKRAQAMLEQQRGADDPDLALVVTGLGDLYRATGKYAQAEPLYARAAASLEKAGPEHRQALAAATGSLATLYRKLSGEDKES